MERAVETERAYARAAAVRSGSRRGIAVAVCAPLLAFSLWSLIVRPDFIWGSRQAGSIAPDRMDASVRFAMYLLARRAEEYRSREGEYPAGGADIGATDALRYTRVGESGYRITARAGQRELTLSSGDDLAEFLGNSAELIQQRITK